MPITRLGVALAAALLACAGASAQAPAPPAPVARPATPQVMTLATTAWPDGGVIPGRHTQAGDEVSPPLTWTGVRSEERRVGKECRL